MWTIVMQRVAQNLTWTTGNITANSSSQVQASIFWNVKDLGRADQRNANGKHIITTKGLSRKVLLNWKMCRTWVEHQTLVPKERICDFVDYTIGKCCLVFVKKSFNLYFITDLVLKIIESCSTVSDNQFKYIFK